MAATGLTDITTPAQRGLQASSSAVQHLATCLIRCTPVAYMHGIHRSAGGIPTAAGRVCGIVEPLTLLSVAVAFGVSSPGSLVVRSQAMWERSAGCECCAP